MANLWLSTLSSIRRGEADWAAIAAYEPPLRRLLGRRFPAASAEEREDAVQDVLLAMREKLVQAYDARAGAFRSFLAVAALNRMRDRLRKRAPQPLAGPEPAAEPAPGDPELLALDLEAAVLAAVRRTHERFVRGPEADLPLVYCLSGVLVDGLSNRALAKREGLSGDQVKRKLQKARQAIVLETLRRLDPEGDEATLAAAGELVRQGWRTPRKRARLLDAADPDARRAAERLLTALGAARDLDSQDPDGLLAGVDAIFAP
ncbi:MAG: sigma-70 family RNA polymerase sigma factor [Planctomycetota bacterium]